MSANEIWQATIYSYLQRLNKDLATRFVQSIGHLNIGNALPEREAIEAVYELCKRKRKLEPGQSAGKSDHAAKKQRIEISSDSNSSDSSDDDLASKGKAVGGAAKLQSANAQNSPAKAQPVAKKPITITSNSDEPVIKAKQSAVAPGIKHQGSATAKQPTKATVRPVYPSSSSDSDSSSDSESGNHAKMTIAANTKQQGKLSAVPPPKAFAAASTTTQKPPAAKPPAKKASSSSSSSSDSDDFAPKSTVQKSLIAAAKSPVKTQPPKTNVNVQSPVISSAKRAASSSSSDSSDSDSDVQLLASATAKITKTSASVPKPQSALAAKTAIAKAPVVLDSDSDSDTSSSDGSVMLKKALVSTIPPKTAVGKQTTAKATHAVASPAKKPIIVADSDSDSDSSSSDDIAKPIAARNEPPPQLKAKSMTSAAPAAAKKAVVTQSDSDSDSDSDTDDQQKSATLSPKKDVPPKWVTQAGASNAKASPSKSSDGSPQARQAQRGGLNRGSFKCFTCGEEGHASSACSQGRGGRGGRGFAATRGSGPTTARGGAQQNKVIRFTDD